MRQRIHKILLFYSVSLLFLLKMSFAKIDVKDRLTNVIFWRYKKIYMKLTHMSIVAFCNYRLKLNISLFAYHYSLKKELKLENSYVNNSKSVTLLSIKTSQHSEFMEGKNLKSSL